MYIPVKTGRLDLTAKPNSFWPRPVIPRALKWNFSGSLWSMPIGGLRRLIGQLKKIGIEASMLVLDGAALGEKVRDGDYAISLRR